MSRHGFALLILAGLFFLAGTSAVQAQNPTTSTYQYLTVKENTIFNDIMKFWYQDTLYGKVHSNDTLSLQGLMPNSGPVFYDTVSTSAPIFLYFNNADPFFAYEPIFNAPRVALPTTADNIRDEALNQGNFFNDENGQWAHRLVFTPSGWTMYRWPMGQPFQGNVVSAGGIPDHVTIFVDGYLELQGLVRGTVTVGAHGSNDPAAIGKHCIRLMNDVRYWNSDSTTGYFDPATTTDLIQIISEGDIVIGNTPANGRDNGWNVYNHNPAYSSIIITGALLALNSSFTFEDQNDNFIWEYSSGYQGPTPDHRGDIWVYGSIAQRQRCYYHRSNHSDTGYGKHFYYDARMDTLWLPGIPARHIPLLAPPQLTFGNVQVGHSKTKRVSLKDAGGTYIDVQSGHTGTSLFSAAPIDSLTLSPGDHTFFEVTFTPTAPGLFQDTLTIELYYGADLKVPLRGRSNMNGGDSDSEELEIAAVAESARPAPSFTPNPFNPTTAISYQLQAASQVRLTVWDTTGRLVATFVDGQQEAGQHSVTFDGSKLASGIYLVQLMAGGEMQTHKIVLMK